MVVEKPKSVGDWWIVDPICRAMLDLVANLAQKFEVIDDTLLQRAFAVR
jgi:hypothetical protein